MSEDCTHDYENPIRKGRAYYVCPDCGADISLQVILMYEDKPRTLDAIGGEGCKAEVER